MVEDLDMVAGTAAKVDENNLRSDASTTRGLP